MLEILESVKLLFQGFFLFCFFFTSGQTLPGCRCRFIPECEHDKRLFMRIKGRKIKMDFMMVRENRFRNFYVHLLSCGEAETFPPHPRSGGFASKNAVHTHKKGMLDFLRRPQNCHFTPIDTGTSSREETRPDMFLGFSQVILGNRQLDTKV